MLRPGSALAADGLTWLAESRGRIDEALRWNAETLKAEPSDEFEFYWTRSDLFLSVGLPAPPEQQRNSVAAPPRMRTVPMPRSRGSSTVKPAQKHCEAIFNLYIWINLRTPCRYSRRLTRGCSSAMRLPSKNSSRAP